MRFTVGMERVEGDVPRFAIKNTPFCFGTPEKPHAFQVLKHKKEVRMFITHIFFHPDYNRRFRNCTGSADAAKGSRSRTLQNLHHRRWGLSPRPEDISIQLSDTIIIQYSTECKCEMKEKIEQVF